MGNFTRNLQIKGCSRTEIATGLRAHSLYELRDRLETIDEDCIFQHFWGRKLNSQVTRSPYHNDFARWAHIGLRDQILCERFNIIDPTDFNLEDLRQELIGKIELRLEEGRGGTWVTDENRFHFIRSTLVIFGTEMQLKEPSDLLNMVPKLSLGNIFYHFIDAQWRNADKKDDFSLWLMEYGDGYRKLIEEIQPLRIAFFSLEEFKQRLNKIVHDYFVKRSSNG